MIRTFKWIVRNIQSNKRQELEEAQFNGYGFMRRVYGEEVIPDIDSKYEELLAIENLPKPFKHVPFNNAIE